MSEVSNSDVITQLEPVLGSRFPPQLRLVAQQL